MNDEKTPEKANERYVQLANELAGAQIADRILREVWEAASPAAKRATADAFLEQIRSKAVELSTWDIERLMKDQMAAYAKECVEATSDQWKAKVSQLVISQLDDQVHLAVDACLRAVLREFKSKLPVGSY